MSVSWHLEDADPRAQTARYTFYKPSRRVIEKLKPGNCCKLIFRFASSDLTHPAAERMWVIIDEVNGGQFTGRLDNDPYYITDIKAGDAVDFGPEHIIDVDVEDDEPNLAKGFLDRRLVTKRIIDQGARVGFFVREEPLDDDINGYKDSGWRFSAGDEDQAYLDAPCNCQFLSLGWVLNKDDSFLDLLSEPVGAAFVRDEKTGKFRRLE
jgi:hypothetical protein